jgi:hypothetical protein
MHRGSAETTPQHPQLAGIDCGGRGPASVPNGQKHHCGPTKRAVTVTKTSVGWQARISVYP